MKMRLITLFLILWVSSGFVADSAVWERINSGINEPDILTIFVHPSNEDILFAGTSKALYRSKNGGRDYHRVLHPSGELKAVNDIYIAENGPEVVYVATDSGLYVSKDIGDHWERMYYSSKLESRRCISVIRFDDSVYLGTEDGIFIKKDKETEWQTINGRFSRKSVYHSAQDKRFIYFATGEKLYSFDKQVRKVQQIFSLGRSKLLERDEFSETSSENFENESIRTVQVSN